MKKTAPTSKSFPPQKRKPEDLGTTSAAGGGTGPVTADVPPVSKWTKHPKLFDPSQEMSRLYKVMSLPKRTKIELYGPLFF